MDLSAVKARLLSEIARELAPSPAILDAMQAVPREEFVPASMRRLAYEDSALSLGWGSTISQPSMVAIVLEEARIVPGTYAFEAGSGCGYLLALMVQSGASVRGAEIVPQLADAARETLSRLGYDADVIAGDARSSIGSEKYDRIIFSAALRSEPTWAVERLNDGGFILAPIGDSGMQELMRIGKGWSERTGRLCRFVRYLE